MKFTQLAKYFQKLEETASRNTMIEILSELLRETEPQEIDKVVYLTQGRVAPLFEPVEFGMAEKMVVKAVARAYGLSDSEVTEQFKKSGDLGATAEALSEKSKAARGTLSVGEVFEKLAEIASSGGEGSVEKKVSFLADLLSQADSISARFLARIPVDNLRLGFSDMTVLDALSWMIDGTKKHKTIIETAYNIRPDLGYIASQVKGKGVAGLSHVKPKVGTPILVMRAERLTNAEDILGKTGGEAAVEPKLDGLRTQLHFKKTGISSEMDKVRIFSRGLENVTAMYPDLVAAAISELNEDEIILDGEAIGYDPKTGKFLPFQETVQRKRKYEVDLFSQNVPLRLVTFDCLYLNGQSLIDERYVERRKILEKIIGKGIVIVPADMEIISDAAFMEKMFEKQVAKGLEGIMAKKLDGTYQAGARGWNWIKLKGSYTEKLADTVDAVVMGIDFGKGKRSDFGVGAFLIGVFDPDTSTYKTISKVGTGLTDEEWRELKTKSEKLKSENKPTEYDTNKIMDCDVWIKPELVGEFKADELTKSPMHTAGFALRFPRLVRWREKKPEDSTSLKEISQLAKLQKKG
jgi:DNA ligase-1